MLNLKGEYDCKADAKGRIAFPASLKKQLESVLGEGFVINRNIHEKCLVLYPAAEWRKVSTRLSKLNRLVKKNDTLIRLITQGATDLSIDAAGRLLLPRNLCGDVSIRKEVKLLATGGIVEVWDKQYYLDKLNEDIDVEALADEVLGDLNFGDD